MNKLNVLNELFPQHLLNRFRKKAMEKSKKGGEAGVINHPLCNRRSL